MQGPSLTRTDQTVLQPGMVLTLEPGMQIAPGKMMVHEENIVVRETHAEGEQAVFTARPDYRRNGEDGNPLPYLEGLVYVSMDKVAGAAALQSGQVDALYDPRPSDFLALKDVPELSVRSVTTAQALVLRMRVDLEPWSDVRVRNALKMCQDRAQNLQLAYFGEGGLSIDAHVAPVHPAYCEQPLPEFDPEAAKALLAEAGYMDKVQINRYAPAPNAAPTRTSTT